MKNPKKVWLLFYEESLQEVFLSEKALLDEVEDCLHTVFHDQLRYDDLPTKLSSREGKDFTGFYVLHGSLKNWDVPYQKFLDSYRKTQESQAKEKEEKEYKSYLTLREKYEDRYQSEQDKDAKKKSGKKPNRHKEWT